MSTDTPQSDDVVNQLRAHAITRDNHYVPQLYLKHFAAGSGHLYRYRTLVSKASIPEWKRVHTGGVAYQSHLYTRALAYGDSDEIERWLNRDFETPAERSIQKVINGERLDKEDYRLLVRFLAAQIVRTPAFLIENLPRWHKQAQKQLEETLQDARKELELAQATGRPIRNDPVPNSEYFPLRVTREPSTDGKSVVIKAQTVVGRGTWIFAMRHLLTTTLERLQGHKWTILATEKDLPWFTTDDPVVRLNFRNESDYDFKGGWDTPKSNIFLPLSPKHLLFTEVGEKSHQRGDVVPRHLASLFRKMMAEHAHRYIFSPVIDPAISVLKPRTVDARAAKNDSERWRSWHEQQSLAERELAK
jgi:hypothetical protein